MPPDTGLRTTGMDLPAFTHEDQVAFARLSGDWNPIHVDPLAARRLLFGEQVVHGLHLVCRALETVLAATPSLSGIARLTAVFKSPVTLDTPLGATLRETDTGFEIDLRQAGTLCAEIAIDRAEGPSVPADADVKAAGIPREEPRERTFADFEGEAGTVDLIIDPGALAEQFPLMADRLGAAFAAVLLATTRLVGMKTPGLNSLYSELALTFDAGLEGPSGGLAYEVTGAIESYRILDMRLSGQGLEGTIRAFVRPAVARQLTMDAARALVGGTDLSQRRVLIVGGSRGLGEVAGKLLAAAGADVTLTYAAGQADAERVAAQISAAGGRVSLHPLRLGDEDFTLPDVAFSHVYYFAAPRIRAGHTAAFDTALFETYLKLFGRAPARLVRALSQPARVYYPSTVYIDDPEPGFSEYAAAKSAGETLVRYAAQARQGAEVDILRLPRMRTDQTQSLFGADAPEPAEILWPWVSG